MRCIGGYGRWLAVGLLRCAVLGVRAMPGGRARTTRLPSFVPVWWRDDCRYRPAAPAISSAAPVIHSRPKMLGCSGISA